MRPLWTTFPAILNSRNRNVSTDKPTWLSKMGIKWTSVYGHTKIPYAKDNFADRIHVYEGGGVGGNGIVLTQHLLKYMLDQGAKIIYNTVAVGLVLTDETAKSVAGVAVEKGNEVRYIKARRGVILATASIDQNLALAKDLSPQHYENVKAHHCWSVKTDRGLDWRQFSQRRGQRTGCHSR